MTIKYQIFVSSTFVDLKDERRIVMEQILNLGHIPVGMELFQASDTSQWEYIKKRIKECDYYVLIIGDRYGSVGPEDKSYTQMEYEFAIESEIPTISFLISPTARNSLPKAKVEFERLESIDKFRKIAEQRLVKYWENGDDLGSKIITSLIQLTNERPRIGWVRADTKASSSALEEISKLSQEKRDLQQRIIEMESRLETKSVPSDVEYRLKWLSQTKCIEVAINRDNRLPIDPDSEKENNTTVSLLDILLEFSRKIASGATESSLSYAMSDYLTKIKNGYHLDCKPIIAEFAAENIVEIKYVQTTIFEELKSERVVHMTDYGKALIHYARVSRLGSTGTA